MYSKWSLFIILSLHTRRLVRWIFLFTAFPHNSSLSATSIDQQKVALVSGVHFFSSWSFSDKWFLVEIIKNLMLCKLPLAHFVAQERRWGKKQIMREKESWKLAGGCPWKYWFHARSYGGMKNKCSLLDKPVELSLCEAKVVPAVLSSYASRQLILLSCQCSIFHHSSTSMSTQHFPPPWHIYTQTQNNLLRYCVSPTGEYL